MVYSSVSKLFCQSLINQTCFLKLIRLQLVHTIKYDHHKGEPFG